MQPHEHKPITTTGTYIVAPACKHLNVTFFTATFWIFEKHYAACHDCKHVMPRNIYEVDHG